MSLCNAVAAPPADRIGWEASKFIEGLFASHFSFSMLCGSCVTRRSCSRQWIVWYELKCTFGEAL